MCGLSGDHRSCQKLEEWRRDRFYSLQREHTTLISLALLPPESGESAVVAF